MPEQQIQIQLADVMNQVHAKYGKLISQLLHENAELQAGVEAMGPRLEELTAENAVLREQFNQLSQPAPVAEDRPGGVGLLSANGRAFNLSMESLED
jgi:predicted nuclease with TOPRIM domain